MRCEKAMGRFLDALTGEAHAEPGGEARSHIADCPVCGPQAARYQELWDELGRLDVPGGEAVGSEEKVARRLSDAFWARARAELAASGGGLGRAGGRVMSRSWLAAAALAGLLLGGIGGYLLAPAGEQVASQPMASDGQEKFVLLLRESPDLRARFDLLPMDSVVAEYSLWARQLAARGHLSGAAKLEDEVRFVTRPDGGLTVERRDPEEMGPMVTGFFVIHAADYEEALEITAGAPHLKYGGTIELRAIDQGS